MRPSEVGRLDRHARPWLAALLCASLLAAPAAYADPAPTDSFFITLGTMGGPIPSATRAQPANFLQSDGKSILIDVGDGTLGQLAKAGISATSIDAVVISHLHFDHSGGLLALLGLYQQIGIERPLVIYGPPGTAKLVEGLLVAMQPAADVGPGLPGYTPRVPGEYIRTIELTDGASIMIGTTRLTVAANSHYSFSAGSPEAKRFQSLSLRFDLPERSIVYTGDTGPSAAVERLAKKADLLICEIVDVEKALAALRRAKPLMSEVQLAAIRPHFAEQHLTAEDIGRLGARADVNRIILTHNANSGPEALETIGHYFAGPVALANDLDRF